MNPDAGIDAAIRDGHKASLSGFTQAHPRHGPETILLVEDEAFVRKATAEVLESAGYRVLIASTAAAALRACRESLQSIDLLLSEAALPGMNGAGLATACQSMSPQARVLLMSGLGGQLAGCELHPGQQCLAKPFTTRTLLKKVREVLDTNPFASVT